MSHLPRSLVAFAVVLAAGRAAGQASLIPNQMHTSMTFELHSVADEVELYAGDPQYLFRLDLRPLGALPPRIDFQNAAQAVTLRVRDLSLFEPEPLDAALDDELLDSEEAEPRRAPVSQTWTMRLMPASPGKFVMQCDGGQGFFDFTDMQVAEVYLQSDSTDVEIVFKRPNPVRLERFKLTAQAGKLRMRGFLNARPKQATLQVEGAACELDFTGKPFDGEAEIFVEGTPQRMRLLIPRDTGLFVEGPSQTVLQFDRKGFERDGTALATPGYAAAKCRMRLFFSRVIPKLEVRWDDD